ncbi:MAG: tyrosine-type recombinase/integrase [Methylobacterium radiotolerans]
MAQEMQAGAHGRNVEDIRALLMTAAAAVPVAKIKRGRPPKEPHLIVRPPRTKNGRFMVYIYDAGVEIPTGLSLDRWDDAQTLCDLHKLQKGAAMRGIVAPRMVPVVAALAHLLDADRPLSTAGKAARKSYLKLSTRLATLAKFFGKATFKDVTVAKCKEFIEWRITLPDARYKSGNPEAPLAREASAREDLYELDKAIALYAGEHALPWRPEVFLPKQGAGRTTWLRPVQIDRIYWAIRGRIWDHATGDWKTETVADADGNVVTRRVLRPVETIRARKPMRRFVFIGHVTGTRNTAMRELGWKISDEGGCFDLEVGLIHRRGFGLDPTAGKPRATSRLAPRVVSTLRRWRRVDLAAGIDHVIHKEDGTPYLDSPRRLWRSVMEDAGLGTDVVPHTLRHTAATLLRLAGVDVRKGADLLGMSVQTMVRIYGQWTIEGQEEAAETVADLRALRKANPLLDLVPNVRQPVVMTAPANDDAIARCGPSDRRRVDAGPARLPKPGASAPPRSPIALAIVA